MILLNLSFRVDAPLKDAWLNWMDQVYFPVLRVDALILDCRLSLLLEPDSQEGSTYSLQAACHSLSEYASFLEGSYPFLDARLQEAFPSGVLAFRTAMEVIRAF